MSSVDRPPVMSWMSQGGRSPRAAAHHCSAILDQLEHLGFCDYAGTVGLLCDLLQHLDQGIGDGHAREPLLTAVRAWRGVAAEPRQERQVQIELVHQPVMLGFIGSFASPFQ